MTARILYLFPDTNLFAQCKTLEQLDWQRFGEFDEIHLIVCRPVQSEIDRHKNGGNDRLSKRAKATSSLFREIILGDSDHKAINATPVVRLSIHTNLRPDPSLTDVLDYAIEDDQLVGIAHRFKAQHPDADVRVLTHDTGPMASAKSVGLAVAPIPDDWLLPPEPSEQGKTIQALQRQVEQLQSAEPEVALRFTDAKDNEVECLEGEIIVYDPLTKSEVNELMDRIKAACPIKKDLAAAQPPRSMPLPFGINNQDIKQVYSPPPVGLIERYNDGYRKWIGTCQAWLELLHRELTDRRAHAKFYFRAKNIGSRPAKDALVTISARGSLLIEVPDRSSTSDGEQELLALPEPPKPPTGSWDLMGFGGLAQLAAMRGYFPTADLLPRKFSALTGLESARRRDPNTFYWKRGRPDEPVDKFVYECEQWRHGGDEEGFWGIVVSEEGYSQIAGALQCEVEAENLTNVAKLLIPVRMTVKHESVLAVARDRVDYLIRLNQS